MMFFGGPGHVVQRTKRGFCIMRITFVAQCADCRRSVGALGEWCLLKNSVWEKVWPGTAQKSVYDKMPMKHNLCVGCIEQRLGRKLVRADFDMRSKHNKLDARRRRTPRRTTEKLPFEK